MAVPGSKARLYPAAMLVGAVLDKDGKEIGGVSIDSVYDRTAMRAIEMAREMGDIPGVASEHELTVGTRVSIAVEKKVVAEGLQAVRPAINPPWRRSKAG